MDIKKIVSKILREEYDNSINKLYGYHVTLNNPETIETIKQNGFKVGRGRMEGRGFYSLYKLDRACGYSSKEGSTNKIVKFEITDLSNLLILHMDLAKEILGGEYHLVNQLDKMYGLNNMYNDHLSVFSSGLSKEEYITKLNSFETIFNYRELPYELFSFQSMDFEDNCNVLSYGQYGIQYRINDMSITKPIGIYTLNKFTAEIIDYTPW
jgi:hypothetical protein